eukprot:3702982-Rhodomonas_salina.1
MAAFDLRKMGVSVSSSAGSSLPPPSLAATGGGARQAGVLAGGLRYSDPLDWSAAHVLQVCSLSLTHTPRLSHTHSHRGIQTHRHRHRRTDAQAENTGSVTL